MLTQTLCIIWSVMWFLSRQFFDPFFNQSSILVRHKNDAFLNIYWQVMLSKNSTIRLKFVFRKPNSIRWKWWKFRFFFRQQINNKQVLRTEALHLNPSKIYKNFCPTWIVTVFKYKYRYNIYKICLVHVEGQCLILIFFLNLCINVQAKYDNVSRLQFTVINKGYLSASGSLFDWCLIKHLSTFS